MENRAIKILENYFKITAKFVDKTELSRLFTQFGYERESLSWQAIQTLALANKHFAKAYGELVEEAQKGREWQMAMKTDQFDTYMDYLTASEATELGKGIVQNAQSNLGTQPSSSGGNSITGIFGAITDLLKTGVDSTLSITDRIKGRTDKVIETNQQYAQAQLLQAEQQANGKKWLVIGGVIIGLFAVVMAIVLITKK